MVRRFVVGVSFAVLGAAGAAAVGAAPVSAITPAQCNAHAAEGKVAICHRTKSIQRPYVQISVSLDACDAGHGDHIGDYLTDSGECATPPGRP